MVSSETDDEDQGDSFGKSAKHAGKKQGHGKRSLQLTDTQRLLASYHFSVDEGQVSSECVALSRGRRKSQDATIDDRKLEDGINECGLATCCCRQALWCMYSRSASYHIGVKGDDEARYADVTHPWSKQRIQENRYEFSFGLSELKKSIYVSPDPWYL